MIVFCVLVIFVISIALLLYKRVKESLHVSLVCFALLLNIISTCLFIAKRGGITEGFQILLFFNSSVKQYFQYKVMTLQELGYFTAIARYIFPALFMFLAFDYIHINSIFKKISIKILMLVLPVISLVLYYPDIYNFLYDKYGDVFQKLTFYSSRVWITAYVFISIFFLLYELIKIKVYTYKKQFLLKILMFICFGIMYLLFSVQDPTQIYRFYKDSFMSVVGIWYLSPKLNILSYYVMLVLSVIFTVLGFTVFLKFTHVNYIEDKKEIQLKLKAKAANNYASVFVHSVKNQLLANKILHRKINDILKNENVENQALLSLINILNKITQL